MSELPKISAIGCGFSHAYGTTLYKKPTYFQWVYNEVLPVSFWFDNSIKDGIDVEGRNKNAWLLEGHSIIPDAVQFVKENVDLVSCSYRRLFTHNKEISELAPNFYLMLPHGNWLDSPQLYPKTKLVSLISSSKNWTDGHKDRLNWVNKFRDKVDLYGRGFNEFEKHEDALADYYFTIVIENKIEDYYITEKLISALGCGCYVIYAGSKGVGQYFNTNSIIHLDDNFDINSLTPELYWSKIDAIKDNLERAKNYDNIEDILWQNFLKYDHQSV